MKAASEPAGVHQDRLPLTVVVVAYGMARELPRTLASLAPPYQRGIGLDDYEVVVVDNGSPVPVAGSALASFPGRIRLLRLDPASPSPAAAANAGIEAAEGELVGLIIDGARMASPGLLATAWLARGVNARPVIATAGWHLGSVRHMEAAAAGYDQATEDELLERIDWRADGYRLFEVSTLAGSSGRGWFGPLSESSALFMTADLWADPGGLDERFAMPGGGLVNHDLYVRACGRADTRLVMLLGEGTFHQFHGGAATSARFGWDEMHDDYVRLRGERYVAPPDRPVLVGRYPEQALEHMVDSITMARRAIERRAAR